MTTDLEENVLSPELDISIRAIVTTKEAGVVIGKEGKSVSVIREITGVKVGVSKVIPGIHERILSVSGPLPNVSKAFALISENLIESLQSTVPDPSLINDSIAIRLLVSHQLVGSVIGKSGSKIREIQEESGAKIVVSKDMLPQSTERIVEVYGVVDSIHLAIYHIGKAILNDLERGVGAILYDPQQGGSSGVIASHTRISPDGSLSSPRILRTSDTRIRSANSNFSSMTSTQKPRVVADSEDSITKDLSIHADMVGCVIGRGGSFISHIRRSSGARLHISDEQGSSNERTVTITGSDIAVNKALKLLYTQLETEKERRESMAANQTENYEE